MVSVHIFAIVLALVAVGLFIWLRKEQLESASRMVENFKELYGKVGYPKALLYNLDRKLDKQLWQL